MDWASVAGFWTTPAERERNNHKADAEETNISWWLIVVILLFVGFLAFSLKYIGVEGVLIG